MKPARVSVRFQNTPKVLGAEEEALMDALQFDESSMASSMRSGVNMTEASFMSEGRVNRLNYVGRTPHAKVIESEQNRRKLEELTRMMHYMPSPVQASPTASQESPQSDISYSPGENGPTPLHVDELSTAEYDADPPQTFSQSNRSEKSSSSNESSFNIVTSTAEKILDSMPNASMPASRSKPAVDSSYSVRSANRPPLTNIGNKLSSPAPNHSDEKPALSKAVSFHSNSERKPKTKAPVTPFVRANISSSDESQIMDENSVLNSPMIPRSSAGKQLFVGSSEKTVATITEQVVEEANEEKEDNQVQEAYESVSVSQKSGEKQVEFIFLQAPKPDSRDAATNYSPQSSGMLQSIPSYQPHQVAVDGELFGVTKVDSIRPPLYPVQVMHFQQTLQSQAIVNAFSPATKLHMEGGVAFGKGPVMACFQSRKAEYSSKQVAVETVSDFVPKISSAQPKAAELRPAKINRSPKTTRKNIPHVYHHVGETPTVKSLITIPEESEVEFEPASLDAQTSIYIDEQEGDDESTFAQVASYCNDLYAIEHLSAASPAFAPAPSSAVDVSIQVDSKLFSSAKKDHKKKQSKDMNMQTSFSYFENPASTATTPQQSLYSSYMPSASASDMSPHQDEESQVDIDRSYALIDLLPPKIGNLYNNGSHHVRNIGMMEKKSVSNPWCSMPFDSTVCSPGGSASKSTVEMSNMYLANMSASSKMSALGKPRRVLVGLNEVEYEREEEENESISYQSLSVSEAPYYQTNRQREGMNLQQMMDVTLQTDVAVAQYSQEMVHEEDMLSLRSALTGGANTTFTLDQSFMTKTTLSALDAFGNNKEVVPRFVIKSLKRTPDYPFEVKEINFDTAPGEFTTVMMVFNNHRSHPVTLNCSTVLVRLEPTYDDDVPQQSQSWLMPTADAEFFTVTPSKLTIEGNCEGTLLVTFAPPSDMQGIFSGAMRIMQNHKSSIILLRGESSRGHAVKEVLLPSFYHDNLHASAPAPAPQNHSPYDQYSVREEEEQVFQLSSQASFKHHSSAEKMMEEVSEMVSEMRSPASIKQLFSEIKGSPTMAAYASKLRALHARIAEFGRRVAWNEKVNGTPSTVASGLGANDDETKLITPECVLVEQINDYCAVNLENASSRPLVVRISASNNIICPCYPQDDSKLICVSAHSTSRFLVRVDEQQLLQKAVNDGFIDCLCGSVVLQYNSGEDCNIEVSVLLSRQLVNAIMANAKQQQNIHAPQQQRQQQQQQQIEQEEEVAASFQSTIRTTASMQEFRSSRVSFQQSHDVTDPSPVSTHQRSSRHSSGNKREKRHQQQMHMQEKQKEQRYYYAPGPNSLYFEHQLVSFGAVRVGSDVRLKVRLCNATDREMLLYLGEPGLPFKIKHHQIAIRSRSCVQLPISFCPTMEGEYAGELIVQSEDGEEFAMARLSGHASL